VFDMIVEAIPLVWMFMVRALAEKDRLSII
jgi:hypothetical protein